MRRPAANLFRFSPDYAQREAGLGAYAYHTSAGGGRRSSPGTPIPGGRGLQPSQPSSAHSGAPSSNGPSTRAAGPRRACAGPAARRHSDVSVRFDTPARSSARSPPNSTIRAACWCGARTSRTRTHATVGPRLDGVVGTHVASFDPSVARAPRLPAALARRVPRAARRLRRPFGGHRLLQRVETVLTALGRVRSADVTRGIDGGASALRLALPGGRVSLDRNRQAVRDGYLSRIVDQGGKLSLEPVRVVPHVEQSFGGLLSKAPPPGPGSQPCKRANAPGVGAVGRSGQPAIVQVKRVSLPRGARPPGRTPRRTSTAGVVVWVASAVRARPSPSRRHRSVRPTTMAPAPRAASTSAAGSGSTRTGSVATPSERCTAMDALARSLLASRPSAPVSPQRAEESRRGRGRARRRARRRPSRARHPRTARGPARRKEARPDHDADVARCLVEQREYPGVLEQAVRRVHEEKVDVVLAREPGHVHAGGDRREDRGTCLDAVRDQPRADVVRKRGGVRGARPTSRRSSSGGARGRLPRERRREGGERFEPPERERGNEERPPRRASLAPAPDGRDPRPGGGSPRGAR